MTITTRETTAAGVTNKGAPLTNAEVDANFIDLTTAAALRVEKTADTGSAKLPSGTTAQRDGVPQDGWMRFNSTLGVFEGYYGGAWQSVGGGQLLGAALTKAIFYNAQTISENITIPATANGLSSGPITIADGYTVTITSGGRWTII